MARGHYLSLEEARNSNKLERFAKEHESKTKKKDFDSLLERMCAVKKPAKDD